MSWSRPAARTRRLDQGGVARAAAVCSIVAASLLAPRPADAQQQTPQQALRAFVATLNQHKPDCSLMTADARELFTDPIFAVQSEFSLGTVLTDADRIALCGSAVAIQQEGTQRTRTIVDGVTVAERTATVVRLHVGVRLRFILLPGEDRRFTIWMEREDGAWKLATSRELLQTGEIGTPAPRSMRQWPAYRRQLTKWASAHRAEQRRQAISARDASRAVASQPLNCDGRTSRAADPTRDVVWASGMDPVRDQSRPTIDMRAASLHSRDGRFCWEVQFTQPPGPSYDINVTVSRRSRRPASGDMQPVDSGQEVLIHVQHDTVLAGVSDAEDRLHFLPVELSQTGNVVRLALTRSDLFHRAGPFDGRHAFRWGINTFADDPAVSDPTSDYLTWMDALTGPPHSP